MCLVSVVTRSHWVRKPRSRALLAFRPTIYQPVVPAQPTDTSFYDVDYTLHCTHRCNGARNPNTMALPAGIRRIGGDIRLALAKTYFFDSDSPLRTNGGEGRCIVQRTPLLALGTHLQIPQADADALPELLLQRRDDVVGQVLRVLTAQCGELRLDPPPHHPRR